MAHQMSPPQQPPPQLPPQPQPQQVPRPYSPYQTAASPTGIALPPAKRPRLSPNPQSPHLAQSPYAPPQGLPESPYNTYSPINQQGSPPAFNAPQQYAASPVMGTMGPPPKPVPEKAEKEEKEKITDISDVTDVFHGSGIDLREEENYMTSTYRNSHKPGSFNTSFNSGTTIASPNNSFGAISQGSFGSQPAFAGSGPISQPSSSQETAEEELERKHRAAAHALAEKRQQHLSDPFLQANNIRHRMHRIAYDQGVALNVEGLFDKLPERPTNVHGVASTGPNGTAAAVKAHGLLQENAPLAEILALVSLAANERVRTMVDESYTIARGRRYGSHGIVPPNLSDLALGENPSMTSAPAPKITNSSWEKAPADISDGSVTVKAETPETTQLPTKSFSSAISTHLVDVAKQDRDAERERVRKRQERAKRANAGNPDAINTAVPGPVSAVASPSAAATPAPADSAAQIAPEKPMTKKERERQAKMGQTEEVLHKNANTTAAMQLGLGKKKKYSWLTGGAPATPVNPYKPSPKPATASAPASGPGSGRSSAGAAESGTDRALQARDRKWGTWREDGIEGRGIQIRDWIVVLERDGKEKKALQKCLLRLDGSGGE